MLLRAEAWTLPTSASFEKITDVPMLAGSSGSRELSSYSDNTLIVNSTWDRFDDIRKSLIRIFDDDTVIDEHEVKRIAKSPQRPSQFQVSGPQANGLVEKLLIYPRTDSVDAQDWIWGGENALPPLGLSDLNNVNEEWSLWSDATSGTMTLTVDGQTTTTFAYNTSDPASIENRIQALSNVNDVTVAGEGTEDTPWTIIFYDPPDPDTVTVDDSGLSGGTATLDKEQEGGLDPSPITQSQRADQRVNPAEHGTYGNPPIIPITQSNLDTDASWALEVHAESQFAGCQIQIGVNPGQTYQASIRVKPLVAGKYRLVIRDLFENEIKKTSPSEVSLTAGSYQDLEIADVVIPDGVTEVIMRVAVVSSAPAEIDTFWVNWEGAVFAEGMAPTTFTEIVRLLVEDAQDRGAFEFLDPDFTDTADTAGNVLEDESFTAFAFSNLGHVMADGSDLGYKWRIRPKATPAGALTHNLQVYLEGEVEDLTTSSGGPTVQTGSVDDAAVVSRSPDFTVAIGWGAGGLYAEVDDAALVTEYGRIERVFDAEHLSSVASLERMLDEKFREQAANEDALAASVPGDAQRVPLIDYAEGSKIWWAFPDEGISKVAKTVQRVSWTHGKTAEFTLQASEVLSEQAGMARAVHHLLRKFERRRGGSGAKGSASTPAFQPPGAFVHLTASNQSIAVDGEDVEWASLDALGLFEFNPTFPTTTVRIPKAGYYNLAVTALEWESWAFGGEVSIWRNSTQVWPPTADTKWSTTAEATWHPDTAHSVWFEAGDTFRLHVDHGSSSAQTLASVAVSAYLVDRGGFTGEVLAGYRVELNTNEDHILVRRRSGGAFNVLSTVAKAHSHDTWYWMRARIDGQRIRAKTWAGTEGSEPGTWDVDVEDTAALAPSSGWGGLAQYSIGATTVTRRCDVLEVTNDEGTPVRTDFSDHSPGPLAGQGWTTISRDTLTSTVEDGTGTTGDSWVDVTPTNMTAGHHLIGWSAQGVGGTQEVLARLLATNGSVGLLLRGNVE